MPIRNAWPISAAAHSRIMLRQAASDGHRTPAAERRAHLFRRAVPDRRTGVASRHPLRRRLLSARCDDRRCAGAERRGRAQGRPRRQRKVHAVRLGDAAPDVAQPGARGAARGRARSRRVSVCTTSRRSTSTAADRGLRSAAALARTRKKGWCRRTSSCRCSSDPAPSSMWANGCCCRRCAISVTGRGRLEPIRVAVNVSPLQLRRRDFVDRVLAAIEPASSEPAGVDIEITESMLMQDLELSIRKLSQLREAGIGIAIDDFGTGYSSLRLLAGCRSTRSRSTVPSCRTSPIRRRR